jgi:hypothetical protein
MQKSAIYPRESPRTYLLDKERCKNLVSAEDMFDYLSFDRNYCRRLREHRALFGYDRRTKALTIGQTQRQQRVPPPCLPLVRRNWLNDLS